MAIDLLAGALTGGGVSDPEQVAFGNNMLSIYVAPDSLGSKDYLAAAVDGLTAWVKSSAPIDPKGEVLVPGEVEARNRRDRLANGIPIELGLLGANRQHGGAPRRHGQGTDPHRLTETPPSKIKQRNVCSMSESGRFPSAGDLEALKAFDTPTICNALEIVEPSRRGYGYTSETFFCVRPSLPPIVGYAKTATIRASQPNIRSAEEARAHRLAYLKFVSEGPRPSIIVVQDLDDNMAGRGSFWGEVHSTIHQALGAVGAITNGAVRDVTTLASGFQILARKVVPSHAYDHLVDFGGEVNVCGMVVKTGDVIHADQHGAVVIPADAVARLPAAADLVSRREAVLLKACAAPDFDYDSLVRALGAADQIVI